MLSRRGFLISALAGISSLAVLRFALAKPEQVIADVLQKRLSYLKLDEPGVLAFARDAVAINLVVAAKLRAFGAAGMFTTDARAGRFHVEAIRHGEERIVTTYLLSTDFFQTGADKMRTVRYLGMYKPFWSAPCLNPFARFDENDAV